jgi:hypothetical protein
MNATVVPVLMKSVTVGGVEDPEEDVAEGVVEAEVASRTTGDLATRAGGEEVGAPAVV